MLILPGFTHMWFQLEIWLNWKVQRTSHMFGCWLLAEIPVVLHMASHLQVTNSASFQQSQESFLGEQKQKMQHLLKPDPRSCVMSCQPKQVIG